MAPFSLAEAGRQEPAAMPVVPPPQEVRSAEICENGWENRGKTQQSMGKSNNPEEKPGKPQTRQDGAEALLRLVAESSQRLETQMMLVG